MGGTILHARAGDREHELIREAAQDTGTTVSAFVRDAAVAAAQFVVGKECADRVGARSAR